MPAAVLLTAAGFAAFWDLPVNVGSPAFLVDALPPLPEADFAADVFEDFVAAGAADLAFDPLMAPDFRAAEAAADFFATGFAGDAAGFGLATVRVEDALAALLGFAADFAAEGDLADFAGAGFADLAAGAGLAGLPFTRPTIALPMRFTAPVALLAVGAAGFFAGLAAADFAAADFFAAPGAAFRAALFGFAVLDALLALLFAATIGLPGLGYGIA